MADYLARSSLVVTILDGHKRGTTYRITDDRAWAACWRATQDQILPAVSNRRPIVFRLSVFREPRCALDAAQLALSMMGQSLDDTAGERQTLRARIADRSRRRAADAKNRNAPGGSWDHQGR